ncbi:MAG: cyclase family protein [bacterium]
MRIYDVSVPLSSNTPRYPGDPEIKITQLHNLLTGDSSNLSAIQCGAHAGTHVDAPAHFIQGARRVDSLSLDVLMGEALVVEVPVSNHLIDAALIDQINLAGTRRVLFKTRNSDFWNETEFRSDFTAIDAGAAQNLVELGIELVGVDYLSIEKFGSEKFETHHILLSRGVVIVEGLDLRKVPAGKYELICLPLRLAEGAGDGAPARTVLRTIDDESSSV